MKSFLVLNKVPCCKWGMLPDNTFYEGNIPEGYNIAISPSTGYIIVDVDVNLDKNKDGFDHIPSHLLSELNKTFNYPTKRDGRHYWLKYTGTTHLMNKSSNVGIDLRTDKGYVVFYPKGDIRSHLDEVKETSQLLNEWLEELFS